MAEKLTRKDIKEFLQREETRGACPAKELLIKAFLDVSEILDEEKMKIVNHALTCELCGREFESFKEVFFETKEDFERLEKVELSEADRRELRRLAKKRLAEIQPRKKFFLFSIPKLKWVPLAAGLLAVLAVILLLQQLSLFRKDAVYRGGKEAAVIMIEPQGEEAFTGKFRWERVEGAAYYNFDLLDRALNLIWQKDRIQETEAEIPVSTLASLKKSQVYFWKVTAFDSLGQDIISGLQSFKIK